MSCLNLARSPTSYLASPLITLLPTRLASPCSSLYQKNSLMNATQVSQYFFSISGPMSKKYVLDRNPRVPYTYKYKALSSALCLQVGETGLWRRYTNRKMTTRSQLSLLLALAFNWPSHTIKLVYMQIVYI